MAHLHLLCLVLLLGILAEAAVLVEHSLDAGQTFSTAGRILLDEADGVKGTFEREPISSAQLSQLQQLVESDRWGVLQDKLAHRGLGLWPGHQSHWHSGVAFGIATKTLGAGSTSIAGLQVACN